MYVLKLYNCIAFCISCSNNLFSNPASSILSNFYKLVFVMILFRKF